jgi:hypothetical protein
MDGEIIVPDRMSDKPHQTVTDHDGRPLCIDLKGRGRFPETTTRGPNVDAPPMPLRGVSDTGAELQRRFAQLQKERPDLRGDKNFYRNSSPEILDRDDEPKLNTKSIRIQGHVGRGRLEGDEAGEKWALRINGVPDFEIEAFPDTIPNLGDPIAVLPYYVILAAKQVYIPQGFIGDTQRSQQEGRDIHRLASINELVETGSDNFDYTGHGILMKYAGDEHFRRTGAFRFRNASEKVYKKLQATKNWKFWLE